MKINWGTGIVLAFIGFIAFIMYFVVSMMANDAYDHDLVAEDYYKQELEYQNDIDKEKNAKSLIENVSYKQTAEGILISFPNNLEPKDIKGKVFLYRPSNKQLDFETTISLSKSHLLIPDSRLVGGRWNLKIDWTYHGKAYLFKDQIVY